MVLLHVLAAVCRSGGLPLQVFHINHGLRPESESEADLVSRTAGMLGIPFHERRLNLSPGPSMEARARESRYAALLSLAHEWGVDSVHLAHHGGDQIETVVMRLSRRAGLMGLQGIPSERFLAEGVRILRPFLRLDSTAIQDYASEHRIPYCEDASNADQSHLRNRVRHTVLPSWARRSSSISEDLLRLGRQAEQMELEIRSLLPLPGLSSLCGNAWLAIPKAPLVELPSRVATYAVRRILEQHPVLHSSLATSRLAGDLVGLRTVASGMRSLEGGFRLVADRNFVGLRWETAAEVDWGLEPSVEVLGPERTNAGTLDPRSRPLWSFVLTSSNGPLRVGAAIRSRTSYTPQGRRSPVALKRLLQHPWIPRAARPFWPALMDDSGIVQIPPHPPARRCSEDEGAEGWTYCWRIQERDGADTDLKSLVKKARVAPGPSYGL